MVQLYHHLSRKAKAQQSLRESSASVDSSQREFSPLAKMEGTPYAAQTQALHFSAVHNLRDSDDSRSSPLPRDTGFPNRREDDRASIGSSTPSSQSSLSRRDKCARCKKPAIGFDAFVGCSTCLRMYHESCTQNDTSIHEEDWNDWRCRHCLRKERRKATRSTNSTPAIPTRLIAVEPSVSSSALAVDVGLSSKSEGALDEQLTGGRQTQSSFAARNVDRPYVETRGVAVSDGAATEGSGTPMDISSVDSSVDASPSNLLEGREACRPFNSENSLAAQQEAGPVADQVHPNEAGDMSMYPSTAAPPPRLPSPDVWLRDRLEPTQSAASNNPKGGDTDETMPDSHRSSRLGLDPRMQRQLPPLQIPPPATCIGSPTSAVTSETSVSSTSRWPEGWEYRCRVCNKKILKPATSSNTSANGILCNHCREGEKVKQDSGVAAADLISPSPIVSLLGHRPASSLKSLEVQDSGDNKASSLAQPLSPSLPTSVAPQKPTELSRVGQGKRQSVSKLSLALRNPGNHPKKAERRYQHTETVKLRTTMQDVASSRQDASGKSSTVSGALVGTDDSTWQLHAASSAAGQSTATGVVDEQNGPFRHSLSSTSAVPTLGLEGNSSAGLRIGKTVSEQTSSLSSSREITPSGKPSAVDQPSDTASNAVVPFDSTSTDSGAHPFTESATTVSKLHTPSQKGEEEAWLMEQEQISKVGEASAVIPTDHNSNKNQSPKKKVSAPSLVSRLPTRNAEFATQETLPFSKGTNRSLTFASTTERKSASSVSRKAMKSAPLLPRLAQSSLSSESKQTSGSDLSDLAPEHDPPVVTDKDLPYAEDGASEDELVSNDGQTKPEKPAITWKDLILLTLRRSTGGRMTSNQVADWIEENVPGYRGEEIRGSVAAVLSGYSKSQKRPNAIFDKEQNQNDGPKWLWFLVPDYKERVDVRKIEQSFKEALTTSRRGHHAPVDSVAAKASSKAKSSETRRQRVTMDTHSPKSRVTSQAARKTGSTKRPAPSSSSSSTSEVEPELEKSFSTTKESTLRKTLFSDSEEEEPSITPRRSVRKVTSNKVRFKRRKVSIDGKQDQTAKTSSHSDKPAMPSPAEGLSRAKYPVRSRSEAETTERGYFSDLEARGPQPAPDLGPAPSSWGEFLAEAFGHLEEEEAKHNAVHLPLFKEYDEDPRYGGKVEYTVRDLFATRPDKDPSQNGAFFDREAKMKEVAKRPKRSDLRKYRHAHDGESMPFLRTIRASRDPNNPFVEKGKAGKLWDESDEDEKYANSDDEDGDGDVTMQYDEDGVRKYKNMKEMLEMPSDTELALDKDGNLVFREPETIGANGRVKRSRREWKTEYPKGI